MKVIATVVLAALQTFCVCKADQPPTATQCSPSATQCNTNVPDRITFEIEKPTVYELLELYEKIDRRTVLRPNNLPSKQITIRTSQKFSRSQATNILQTVLLLNAIHLVPQGDKYIKAIPAYQSGGCSFYGMPDPEPTPEFVTHILGGNAHHVTRLKHLLQTPGNLESKIVTIPDCNVVIVQFQPEKLSKMLKRPFVLSLP